jgi:hypothetical protein
MHVDLGRLKEAVGLPDDIEEEYEEVQKLLLSDTTLDVTENEVCVAEMDETSEVGEFET